MWTMLPLPADAYVSLPGCFGHELRESVTVAPVPSP
jgi:hypothetical protein